jgi:hypothetical protein
MNEVIERDVPAEVTPMTMLQLAVQQGADMDKLQKLMDLQERWERNEARKAFNRAFSEFKSEAVSMGAGPDSGGAKNGIQARASTVTYLERYTLMAATGLAAQGQDDDGAGRKQVEPDPDGKAKLEACGSMDSLTKAWAALTPDQRKTLAAVKDQCKARIAAS